MKKNIYTKLMIVLVLIILLIGVLALDAYQLAPRRYTIRRETLSSTEIQDQMDGLQIVYFSDLDYGLFMDEKRLNNLITKINGISCDIVLFGGDLFDESVSPTSAQIEKVQTALSSIQAPLGKFAVLGDMDAKDENRYNQMKQILNKGDFEVLSNQSITLHNTGSQGIRVVGIENGLNGNQDIEQAFSKVNQEMYTIALCHTPDSAGLLPTDLTDYFLAAHSHGGQAYLFFDSLYKPAMATDFLRGKHLIGNAFTLDITNGVGTTIKDVRFNANAEIVLYQLKKVNATIPSN